jgi:hypothetical protein
MSPCGWCVTPACAGSTAVAATRAAPKPPASRRECRRSRRLISSRKGPAGMRGSVATGTHVCDKLPHRREGTEFRGRLACASNRSHPEL